MLRLEGNAMADEIDLTEEREAVALGAKLQAIRSKAVLVPGVPGECEMCGEESPRLVGGACAPCRDKYKLQ